MKWLEQGCVAAACFLAVSVASTARATTFVLMNEEQLAARSTAAILGSVTAIETARDRASGSIHTYVHIEPTETVFGDLPSGEVILRERGGILDGVREWIFGNPEYELGEEVLVFVATSSDGTLHTTGMSMGKYTVTNDGSDRATVRRHLGTGTRILQRVPRRSAYDPASEIYDLDDFIGTVQRASRRRARHRRRHEQRIPRLTPPELADASVREWHESFTFLGSPSRWFEPDDGLAVDFLIDQTGDSALGPVSSRAAVDAAFAAWSGVSSSGLALADDGLTGPLAYNGCSSINRVAFNDPYGEIDDPVDCSGVLAIGGYCSSSATRVVNGTTFRRIVNGKVMFNNGWAGCWGWNECNVAEVATHELGHALGLGHSSDSFATMAAFAHFDNRCASLEDDDIAAVTFMYPASTGPTATMTPLPTRTNTPAPTSKPTITATVTQTRTRTQTPTVTTRPTSTERPTATSRPTSTPRPTSTRTLPPSPTTTVTATITVTPIPPPTNTVTPSEPPTATPTATLTSTIPSLHRISGQVHYYSNGTGVPGTSIRLSGATDVSTETTDSGAYAFGDVPAGVWQLQPQAVTGGTRAISALDAAYVLQAVVGLRSLSPTQRLACDATGDGSVSSLDAARILQYTVGSIAALPVTTSCETPWLFIPKAQSGGQLRTIQPSVSGGQCQNGTILFDPLTDQMENQDFDALRLGDCTGNWQPEPAGGPLGPPTVEGDQSWVQLGRLRRNGKATVRLPIYVRPAAPLQALSLVLTYDPDQLQVLTAYSRRPTPDTQLQFAVRPPGRLAIAIASGRRTTRRRSALLVVEFTLRNQDPRASVHLSEITVNEDPTIAMEENRLDRRR